MCSKGPLAVEVWLSAVGRWLPAVGGRSSGRRPRHHPSPLTPHPSPPPAPRRRASGVTLVELVVSIVIFSIALLAILTFLATSIRGGADPMVQEQASAIAQAYLEEILLNGFCDPSFDPDGDPATGCPLECTTPVCAGGCGGAIPGAETRVEYDDICDYDGLVDSGARDQFDQPLAGLESYTVSVQVIDTGVDIGGLSSDTGRSARVDVTVSRTGMDPVTVSGWRVNN